VRWREEDLPALGWRYRELYATKSTFITLACKDGAAPDVIASRVTHTKSSRSVTLAIALRAALRAMQRCVDPFQRRPFVP